MPYTKILLYCIVNSNYDTSEGIWLKYKEKEAVRERQLQLLKVEVIKDLVEPQRPGGQEVNQRQQVPHIYRPNLPVLQ
jgi:hypothetical protein